MPRPPADDKPVAFPNRPLRIRLLQEQRDILDQAAEIAGEPTATWARDILIRRAEQLIKRHESRSPTP